jgi:hypothetical protein
MWRLVAGVVAGILVWWVIGAAGFGLLRAVWPTYAAGEPSFDFTLAMQLARLAVGVACGMSGGIATALVVGRQSWAPWIVGAIQLVIFLPIHVSLWMSFPIWYHLFFLLTLAPLIALGARLTPGVTGRSHSV